MGHDLDIHLSTYDQHCNELLELAKKISEELKPFCKGTSSPSAVLKSLKSTISGFNTAVSKCLLSALVWDAQIEIARKQLFTDNGTRCECGIYYHGIFVSINTSLLDEMIPLIQKLTEYLEEKPFYLTPDSGALS